jgi:hypothetical protein
VLRKGPVSSPEKNKHSSTGGTLTPAPMGWNRGTTLEEAMVNLVSCTDMDLKFSMAWCKRVLPSAHEVYLKGLPPCYPTSTHETHLERAQHSFHAMVRGPAVALFAEKLQADCEVVWHAGQQLCDAKSLIGKPCIHQVHEVVNFGVGPEFGHKSAKVGSVRKGGIQEKVARKGGTAISPCKECMLLLCKIAFSWNRCFHFLCLWFLTQKIITSCLNALVTQCISIVKLRQDYPDASFMQSQH